MKTHFIVAALLGFFLCQPLKAGVYSVGYDKNLYTSDYMIGNVVVSIIFPESNGAIDSNSETWSNDRKSQAISEIMSGLDWWTKQNSKSKLTFTYVVQTVGTKYEPITRPYYDEALWIPDIMSQLGYSGSRFASTRDYVNALRAQYKADWGFVIFVCDSLNDWNGKFADGYFAYSYLGGPFTVMTYDNNGYGIANMDVVVAHETGHIFHALDEYAGASSPSSYSDGYFPTINGNHAYSSAATTPTSIMRGGINWGLDSWAKLMIGWRDADNNGRDDVVDQKPVIVVAQQAASTSDGSAGFNGSAKLSVLPRQSNVNGYGFNVDSITKVEYRPRNGTWAEAVPADGNFDSPEENFNISIPASQSTLGSQGTTISSNDLEVRVVTTFSSYVGSSSAGGGGPSLNLSAAHPYPNPFKPNSGLGHTSITFTHLTPGAKVQIFNPAGEPVFEKSSDDSTGTANWSNANQFDSGVYFFLITDSTGDKKKGKIAIIK